MRRVGRPPELCKAALGWEQDDREDDAEPEQLAVALSAMVLRADVPIEPPACCIVLTSAEATPESRRATPKVAVLMAGAKIMPKPRPRISSAGSTALT